MNPINPFIQQSHAPPGLEPAKHVLNFVAHLVAGSVVRYSFLSRLSWRNTWSYSQIFNPYGANPHHIHDLQEAIGPLEVMTSSPGTDVGADVSSRQKQPDRAACFSLNLTKAQGGRYSQVEGISCLS